MTQPPVYNLRRLDATSFVMAKFSMPDFNVEAVYNLSPKGKGFTCNCPASARAVKLRPCKHQRMLPFMLGAVNTERFYEPESGNWIEPLRLMRNGDTDGLPMTPEIKLGSPLQDDPLPPPAAPPATSPPQAQAPKVDLTPRPSAPTITRRI